MPLTQCFHKRTTKTRVPMKQIVCCESRKAWKPCCHVRTGDKNLPPPPALAGVNAHASQIVTLHFLFAETPGPSMQCRTKKMFHQQQPPRIHACLLLFLLVDHQHGPSISSTLLVLLDHGKVRSFFTAYRLLVLLSSRLLLHFGITLYRSR
jgi:hypothetical protein